MTLLPVALLLAGARFGGLWALTALIFITLIVALLDQAAARAAPLVPEADEFPAAHGLCLLLALAHLLLLPLLVARLALSDPGLSIGARLALFAGFALWLGQVSNPNAHELIHRPQRLLRGLGVVIYASIGYGHHASAHRLVHHRYVATRLDPNSARRGEGFWRFLIRAWPAEFLAGLRAERAARGGRMTPYPFYGAVTLACGAGAYGLGGGLGLAIWLGLSAWAQIQLYLSDYVQHYGLRRALLPDGRYARVGPQHSWDAPARASAALMLNAPRHSDHHSHPERAYPGLRLPPDGLRLPYSLPVMAAIALWPRAWFALMNPRLPPLIADAKGR